MWSPWRSRLINQRNGKEQNPGDHSLFYDLAAQNRDRENPILWRGAHVFVIMNLYPYNNGHLLIVPFREVDRYEDLTQKEQVELATTLERCIRWLNRALHPEGFNVGMNLGKAAGAGIPHHLHMHVVPRWSGDTNFMPAVGDVKVLPEALEETYDKLLTTIKELE
jgi:ATP adenylyltransferase